MHPPKYNSIFEIELPSFPLRGHLPRKTDFVSLVPVGVLLSAYRQTDKFLSHNDQ